MRRRPFIFIDVQRALAMLMVALATPAVAQQPAQPAPRHFAIDVAGFYQSLDNGYSDWRGADLRVWYPSAAFTPFVNVSTQRRREGRQENLGAGAYVMLSPHFYTIVNLNVARGGTAVFYPRLRADAMLVSDSRVVSGLQIATGVTHFTGDQGSSGQIVSVGPIYYRGPLILSGSARVNRDGVSGAKSGSGDLAAQYGAQGRYWLGGSVSTGREAYQLLSATPFDVRFTSVGSSLFYQKWITAGTAITTRFDYEHKRTAYRRRGITLSYHVEL